MSQFEDATQVVREVGGRVKQYLTVAAGSLGLTGGRALSGPLHAEIGISDPCNHKCVMCYNYPPDDRHSEATEGRFGLLEPGLMSLDTFKGVVDDLHRLGTRRVDLVARGEPLLNRAAIDMVAYAKERGMHVILCTNASKLSADKADRLVQVGLDRVNVSLNAGTPQTYPNIHVTETPENYLKVKQNLRYLADSKIKLGKTPPFVRLSFVIGTQNYFELQEMIEVTHEVGATEATFVHNQVHEKTRDLALSVEQYEELSRSILPRAKARANELGVSTNLAAFAATVPLYLTSEVKGPPVVPCYVGYYFTVVLGNGTVLPCCQCSNPIDAVSKTRSFADIWTSESYNEFRKAAKELPEPSDRLKTCECDQCYLRPRNISIHNLLHPWNRIEGGDEEQMFSISDLTRMIRDGSSVKVHGPQ